MSIATIATHLTEDAPFWAVMLILVIQIVKEGKLIKAGWNWVAEQIGDWKRGREARFRRQEFQSPEKTTPTE